MVGPLVVQASEGGGAATFAFAAAVALAFRSGRRLAAAVPARIVADWIKVRRVSLELVMSYGPFVSSWKRFPSERECITFRWKLGLG